MSFEQMWQELAPIGRDRCTGGYHRLGWSSAELECRAWFLEECAKRQLDVVTDGNGNVVAWWGKPGPGAVVTGSHLDSVPDGGAYDGPLGVVSALAAIDLLRDGAFEPARAISVVVFAEEEGSRFGLPCLGSRLATGAVAPERARELRDRDGRWLADVLDSDSLGRSHWLDGVGTFVELHIEQGRGLVGAPASGADLTARRQGGAVGVASGIWPHGRWRFDFAGQADHAGTTAMADRRDPMLTFAMTALAANKQARASGARATFGRTEVAPNATNAIPAGVRGWLDARAAEQSRLTHLVESVRRQAADRAERDGTTLSVQAESVSAAVHFDRRLRDRLCGALGHPPVLSTAAGHDAGVLASAGIPAGMLFVRNPTGVSHAPQEHAELTDCLAGVEALASVLADLAGAAA